MSLVQRVNNPAIDNLVQSSLGSEYGLRLEWIPYEEITCIKPTQVDNIHYARHYNDKIMLLCLGNNEECTPTLVSEFARIYSLPTHKYNDANQFRRYSVWLSSRNNMIEGFTKSNDKYRNKLIKMFTKSKANYYMVADRKFYDCYSRYGFCAACGILRCSSMWCICGHKQLSDGWTSNNKQLDEFIKKSQLQTNSPNHAYLEWIPVDYIEDRGKDIVYLHGLPINYRVKLIPLEITDETHDLYYAEVNYLMRHVY